MRGQGVGKALFRYLGQLCEEKDLARLDWVVLDWNEVSFSPSNLSEDLYTDSLFDDLVCQEGQYDRATLEVDNVLTHNLIYPSGLPQNGS